MASLHHRPSRGDLLRPSSTAPQPSSTAYPRAHYSPRGIYTTALLPPQQFAVAWRRQAPSPTQAPACSGGRHKAPRRHLRRRAAAAVRSGPRMGCFGDREMKRRRRVRGYKAYGVEGK
ncbi:hypothetical protein HU200_005740 [Digitaria exilis]|uniref:Uncharacterized protein n=1 Tax=Digitaria exilis TaxID=1010633 RepID=A0A835FRG4_9POAL|nr:hypothetical protein HU200_005740 [Digitaria exilis]